jgi:molecular chaperone IbpA
MRIDYTPFFRSTVGFDRLLGLLESASEQGYPPYNIERSDENNYRVTLAVAGFAEKDLSVDVKDRVLTVSGKREDETLNDKPAAFLHQGIAGRAFERSFQLAEHVEVKGARLENGLLHVDLERIVPEEKRPRRIAINAPELTAIQGSKAAA